MAVTQHFLTKHTFEGSYGDRPQPWEVTFTCGGCGEELWTAEEGYGGSAGTPADALEDHLREIERVDDNEIEHEVAGSSSSVDRDAYQWARAFAAAGR